MLYCKSLWCILLYWCNAIYKVILWSIQCPPTPRAGSDLLTLWAEGGRESLVTQYPYTGRDCSILVITPAAA